MAIAQKMAVSEMLTMTECNKALIDGIAAGNVDAIADELLGSKLIAKDVYDASQLPTKTKPQKARDIVMGVTSKVQTNPKDEFLKFFYVLQHHHELENLVKLLEDKYCELTVVMRTYSFLIRTVLSLDR